VPPLVVALLMVATRLNITLATGAVAAVINLTAEEFLFRHSVNAVLCRQVGRFTLVAFTSSYFGMTYLNGTPSGPVGPALPR
jgi:hypothetical protein